MPKSILTGKGEQENKQTLVELKDMFLRSRIGSIQEKIANAVCGQVFKQLADVNGWKEVPKIRFVKRNRYDVDEVIALKGAGLIDNATAMLMLR